MIEEEIRTARTRNQSENTQHIGSRKPSASSVAVRLVPTMPKPIQLYLEKVIFAGAIAGLLDIRDIINAAATGTFTLSSPSHFLEGFYLIS